MKHLKAIKRTAAVLLVLFLLGALLCASVGIQGYRMYRSALSEISLKEKIDEVHAGPDYTVFDEIPRIYLDAVVAVEDHRFYSHGGIDLIAIGRAALNDIRAGALIQGGSTITQQLSKNLFFTQEKEFSRKAAEVFMAFDLEKTCGKDEILELYVNSIYFGNNYYGIREASMGYFQKEPKELNDYECTLLAGIPNAPSVYTLSANSDLAEQRQQQVVRRMISGGFLTEEEAGKLTP